MDIKYVGIVGASGYAGVEATRIIASHPHAELRFVTSDRWQASSIGDRLGITGAAGKLHYAHLEKSQELSRGCAAVLLATPAEVSIHLAPELLQRGITVIDLSGAFRLKDATLYDRFYGFSHPQPGLLKNAAYGLPELFRDEIKGAQLIANPGCYPTAAALGLVPLLTGNLLEADSIIVDSASGTTGAGRKDAEGLSFSEVDEDFRAYRVSQHQHLPEISQSLTRALGKAVPVTFTAHLLPIKRGILSTQYARVRSGTDPSTLEASLVEFYAAEPFVTVLKSPDDVNLKSVVGTNRCSIGLCIDRSGFDPDRLICVSAIDNLVKGAAGQAVQNLNIAMGWPETAGLLNLRGFYP